MSTRRYREAVTAPVPTCDALEPRVLLSTINWTNKGTSSSDADHFTAMFGAFNADRARVIVQRTIDEWERLVVNFNRSGGGTNTFNVTIDADDLGFANLGRTNNITYDAQGKPTSAHITLDNNAGDIGGGWYFDPTPGTDVLQDDSEFTVIQTPFQATNITLGSDLYRTIAHELGHAMGLATSSTRLTNASTDIGDDPVDTGSAHLFTIDINGVPGADYTYTNAGGAHLYEGPSVGGCPIFPNALMNSGRTAQSGQRNLLDDSIATLLRDLYGYTIHLPSLQNTFYVNLNVTTKAITVTGDINPNGSDADSIDLRINTSFQQFTINGTQEEITTTALGPITINANNANDSIVIDSLWPGSPTTIFGGAGDDTLAIAPQSHDLFKSPAGITFNGSIGNDSVSMNDSAAVRTDTFTITPTFVGRPAFTLNMNSLESVSLVAQNGNNDIELDADPNITYNIDGGPGLGDILAYNDLAETTGHTYTISPGQLHRDADQPVFFTPTTEIVRIDAGSGNDAFNFLPGDVYGLIGFNGNGGTDSVNIDDRADSGDDGYELFGTLFQKDVVGTPLSPPTSQFLGIESLVFQANSGNNQIGVYGADIPTSVFGNGGNDAITVNDGTAFVNTGAENTGVAPFGDSIGVNLDADTGEDNPATVIVAQNDEVHDLNVMSGNTIGTLRIATGAVLARSAGGMLALSGIIDLAGGALLVRSPGPTQATWRSQIFTGRNGGAWNGNSLAGAVNSSLAATTPLNDGVGYGLGSQITPTTSIGPFAISANDTLIRYTLDGDANLDGHVNLLDFNKLAGNFNGSNKSWSQGDFNYDGTANLLDFNRLASNFNSTIAIGLPAHGDEPLLGVLQLVA